MRFRTARPCPIQWRTPGISSTRSGMEEASMTAQSLWLQMIIYGAFSASTTPAVRPPMTSTYGGTMLPDCARSKNLFGFGLRDQIRHHAHRYNLGKRARGSWLGCRHRTSPVKRVRSWTGILRHLAVHASASCLFCLFMNQPKHPRHPTSGFRICPLSLTSGSTE